MQHNLDEQEAILKGEIADKVQKSEMQNLIKRNAIREVRNALKQADLDGFIITDLVFEIIDEVDSGYLEKVNEEAELDAQEKMDAENCDHDCTSMCRHNGCNCKCGEWHNELDAVDVATNVAERDASEARTREEMRGEDLSDELRGK